MYDAKKAVDQLNGFNVNGKYLIVLYYHQKAAQTAEKKVVPPKNDMPATAQDVEALKQKYHM